MKNKEHTWPQILDEPNGSQILPGSRLKWGRQAENPFYTSLPKKKKKRKKKKSREEVTGSLQGSANQSMENKAQVNLAHCSTCW
jgi:hypothetical protein